MSSNSSGGNGNDWTLVRKVKKEKIVNKKKVSPAAKQRSIPRPPSSVEGTRKSSRPYMPAMTKSNSSFCSVRGCEVILSSCQSTCAKPGCHE